MEMSEVTMQVMKRKAK